MPDDTLKSRTDLAMLICNDLTKKLRLLRQMPKAQRERTVAGLVDGLIGITQPHPTTDLCLPPIRPAFDAPYEAGYDVAETWARIAQDWPETAENPDASGRVG